MREFGIIARVKRDPTPAGSQFYYIEDMITMGKEWPIKVYIFSPTNWLAGEETIKCFEYVDNTWCSSIRKIPTIIYDRYISKTAEEEERKNTFLSYLTKNGHNFSTPLQLVDIVKDKLKFHNFLSKNKIPSIAGLKLKQATEADLNTLIKSNQAVFIKPIQGSGGKGIAVLIKSNDEFVLKTFDDKVIIPRNEVLAQLKARFNPERYFIQAKAQLIAYENAPYDIRVLVQNNGKSDYQITGLALRLGQKHSWVSNLNSGGRGIALAEMNAYFQRNFNKTTDEITQDISELCLNCCAALTHEYGDFIEIAFDILLTKDLGAIIIEANTKPARWIFNTIADNYKEGTSEHKLYKSIRQKTVVFPLIFATNQNF
ncbi:MAG: hypothetical protein GQ574_01795 [Crocinitomix sp.]|nr:hypothetical protein [Crocinitomix sp.]